MLGHLAARATLILLPALPFRPSSHPKAEKPWAIKTPAISPSEQVRCLENIGTYILTNALGLMQGHKHKRAERPFPSIAGHLVHSSFDTQCPFPTNKLSGSLWSPAFSPSQTLFHPKYLIRNNCLIDLKTPRPGKHAFYTPGVVEIVRNSLQTDVFRNHRREATSRAWARNLPKLRESLK